MIIQEPKKSTLLPQNHTIGCYFSGNYVLQHTWDVGKWTETNVHMRNLLSGGYRGAADEQVHLYRRMDRTLSLEPGTGLSRRNP